MIDHVGIPVRNHAQAKAFYRQALAPLGIGVVMEVTKEQTGGREASGFRRELKAVSSGSVREPAQARCILHWWRTQGRRLTRFMRRHCRRALRTMARQAYGHTTIRIITVHSSSIQMESTSRRSVTSLHGSAASVSAATPAKKRMDRR